MLNEECTIDNGVNETQTRGEGVSLGSDGVSLQAPLGRHQATARRKWNNALYRVVMECYFESKPGTRGYRKRMLGCWNNRGMFKVTEQQLADQARAIRTNDWLSPIELEDIKRKVLNIDNEQGSQNITNNVEEELPENSEQINRNAVLEPENRGSEIPFIEFLNDQELSERQQEILLKIKRALEKGEEILPFSLKRVERRKLQAAVKEVNDVLVYISTVGITETNQLIRAAATVVAQNLGVGRRGTSTTKEPFWKKRIKFWKRKLRS